MTEESESVSATVVSNNSNTVEPTDHDDSATMPGDPATQMEDPPAETEEKGISDEMPVNDTKLAADCSKQQGLDEQEEEEANPFLSETATAADVGVDADVDVDTAPDLPPSNTQVEEDARLQVHKDQQQRAEEQARLEAEQETDRQLAEAVAVKQAEEQARVQIDQEGARIQSESRARQHAEEEAHLQASQELARLEAETQARSMAEEEARFKAQQDNGDAGEELLDKQDENKVVEGSNDEKSGTNTSTDTGQNDVDETDKSRSAEVPSDPVSSTTVTTQTTAPLDLPPSNTQAEEDARLQAHKEKQQRAEEQAHLKADQEADRQNAELVAIEQAEEQAHVQADQEPARIEAESHIQHQAEEEARLQAGQEPTRLESEARARKMGEEAARFQVDQDASRTTTTIQYEGIPQELSEPEANDEGNDQAEKKEQQPKPEPLIIVETPKSKSRVSFASAFGGDPEPSPAASHSSGISFAEAFGRKSKPVSPLASPDAQSISYFPLAIPTASSVEEEDGAKMASNTSLTAFGAAKSKRVSSLVSTYLDKVTKEPLPGDSVKLESSLKKIQYSPTPSPVTRKSVKVIAPKEMPKIGSIRAKFEDSAKSSDSNIFEFGEAFRQKKRFEELADKERKKEAKVNIRGFDEMILSDGKRVGGEVDSSNLARTFAFETFGDDGVPTDGVCKVDYETTDYQGMVFVVHRTRGMLLLNHHTDPEAVGETRIPGGVVTEEEFLAAAKLTGHAKMQLQLASREGAARQLYETTGLDVRKKMDRLTPAVLQMNPPVDAKGTQYLKNEHDNRLYYFLQVGEDDFITELEVSEGVPKLTDPKGEVGSPLKLKLSRGFADFTFIKNPFDAAGELKENGDPGATAALSMVMHQSASHGEEPAKATTYEKEGDAPTGIVSDPPEKIGSRGGGASEDGWTGITTDGVAEDSTKRADPDMAGEMVAGRTDGEADLKTKASTDTSQQQEVVTCCCGFWG